MNRTLRVDEAFVCEDCGTRWYYTRSRCPDCGSAALDTYRIDEGELVATTTAHVTPPDVRSPNHLGVARFDGVRVLAQLPSDDLSVGDRVVFAGAYRLRTGDSNRRPRLTPIED